MIGDSDGGGGDEGGDKDAGRGQGQKGGAHLVLCRPTKAAVLPFPHLSTGVEAPPHYQSPRPPPTPGAQANRDARRLSRDRHRGGR